MADDALHCSSSSASDADSRSTDTMDRNWGALGQQAKQRMRDLTQLTQEADDCKEQSDSSESEPNCGQEMVGSPLSRVVSRAPWWARRLAALTSHRRLPVSKRPLNVISGCTGVSAESFVLEA